MEAHSSAESKTSETDVLLTVIIDELKRIGSTLARQDERIEALSRVKNRSQLLDWDRGSVIVNFPSTQDRFPFFSHSTLRTANQFI
jgi:hypothetical protein